MPAPSDTHLDPELRAEQGHLDRARTELAAMAEYVGEHNWAAPYMREPLAGAAFGTGTR